MHQPHFFLQQQDFKQITDGFGVADDVVANRFPAKPCARRARRFKYGQLASGMRRVAGADHAQRPRIVKQLQQQFTFGGLVQGGVLWFNPRHRQQLGHHLFMLVRTLAQIDRGQMKTEHFHRADQGMQALHDQGTAVVGT